MTITEFQEVHSDPLTPLSIQLVLTHPQKVYTHLLLIPPGRVSTYASLARSLDSSPRAVGGALRNNPYAPEVPCHRVIAASGFVGGFKGDWEKAPSGVNQTLKLKLLRDEGVEFTEEGKLVIRNRQKTWCYDGPWDIEKGRATLKATIEQKHRELS